MKRKPSLRNSFDHCQTNNRTTTASSSKKIQHSFCSCCNQKSERNSSSARPKAKPKRERSKESASKMASLESGEALRHSLREPCINIDAGEPPVREYRSDVKRPIQKVVHYSPAVKESTP